jgi:hypothetical protein
MVVKLTRRLISFSFITAPAPLIEQQRPIYAAAEVTLNSLAALRTRAPDDDGGVAMPQNATTYMQPQFQSHIQSQSQSQSQSYSQSQSQLLGSVGAMWAQSQAHDAAFNQPPFDDMSGAHIHPLDARYQQSSHDAPGAASFMSSSLRSSHGHGSGLEQPMRQRPTHQAAANSFQATSWAHSFPSFDQARCRNGMTKASSSTQSIK